LTRYGHRRYSSQRVDENEVTTLWECDPTYGPRQSLSRSVDWRGKSAGLLRFLPAGRLARNNLRELRVSTACSRAFRFGYQTALP
jgi:hypothetical protein